MSADYTNQQHKFHHTCEVKKTLVVPSFLKCFAKPCLGYEWYGHVQFSEAELVEGVG